MKLNWIATYILGWIFITAIYTRRVVTFNANDVSSNFRLPNATQPIAYDISIKTRIDAADFSFCGTVKIEIIAVELTNSITLHQLYLNIEEIQLQSDGRNISIGQYSYNASSQFLIIPVLETLVIGSRYNLQIDYNGTLRTDDSGFYRSSYVNDAGDTVWLATTQFQLADARHAFPSYDEPGLKAFFKIRITHDQSYSAISNMPVFSVIQNNDGLVTTEFETTPKMSTYILAFVVSDFSYISNNETNSIPQRAFARPNGIDQVHMMLNVGEQMMDALTEYFGVNYSLPKFDQFGIPDFRAGAMENWGCVTYRESYALYDENVSTYLSLFGTVRVIGHEIVHQWFGNFVTPSWWTYIWLSEGFARCFEYIGMILTHPNWGMDTYFVPRILQTVFQSDALESSPPMNLHIEHTDEVSSQFSLITADKAACVIRMFMNVLSEATFLKGLRYYLDDRSYDIASEKDLFASLERAAREDNAIPAYIDMPTVMSSWSSQPGFPLLIVNRNYDPTIYDTQFVSLSQNRYYSTATNGTATWWIPINYATERDHNFEDTRAEQWFPQNYEFETMTLNVSTLTENDWLLLNKQQTGYYRVLYDERNYKLLSDALVRNLTQFHILNRAQLIDDAYNFVLTERLSYNTLLDIARFLEYDNEYATWYPAIAAFTTINRQFAGHEQYPQFRDFLRNLLEYVYKTVGVRDVKDEPLIRKYCRTIAVAWACNMGSTQCQNDATNELRFIMNINKDFHQNVRDILYCASLRNSSAEDFHNVWNRMLSCNDSTTRNLLLSSLGCSSIHPLLSEFLDSSLYSQNANNITYRPGEEIYIFNAVYQNSLIGLEMSIDFLSKHNAEAYSTYGSNNFQNMYIGMAQRVSGNGLVTRFEDLVDQAYANNLILNSTLTRVRTYLTDNQNWLNGHGEIISNWLTLNYN